MFASRLWGPDGAVLKGTARSTTIAVWGQDHEYTPIGPTTFESAITQSMTREPGARGQVL